MEYLFGISMKSSIFCTVLLTCCVFLQSLQVLLFSKVNMPDHPEQSYILNSLKLVFLFKILLFFFIYISSYTSLKLVDFLSQHKTGYTELPPKNEVSLWKVITEIISHIYVATYKDLKHMSAFHKDHQSNPIEVGSVFLLPAI